MAGSIIRANLSRGLSYSSTLSLFINHQPAIMMNVVSLDFCGVQRISNLWPRGSVKDSECWIERIHEKIDIISLKTFSTLCGSNIKAKRESTYSLRPLSSFNYQQLHSQSIPRTQMTNTQSANNTSISSNNGNDTHNLRQLIMSTSKI